jgi:hypothetical protein
MPMLTEPVPIRVDPAAFYDDDRIFGLLGIHRKELARARRSGQLRFVRRGRRILYLGQSLLDWLTADLDAEGVSHGA